MLLDALLQVSTAQVVAAASTVVSTDSIDLSMASSGTTSNQPRDMGPGENLFACFNLDSNAGSTVQFQIISSPNANLTSPVVLVSSGVIAAAELTAGRQPVCIPLASSALKTLPLGNRYLGVQYVTGAGTATTITAYFTDSEVAANKYYNLNFTVL